MTSSVPLAVSSTPASRQSITDSASTLASLQVAPSSVDWISSTRPKGQTCPRAPGAGDQQPSAAATTDRRPAVVEVRLPADDFGFPEGGPWRSRRSADDPQGGPRRGSPGGHQHCRTIHTSRHARLLCTDHALRWLANKSASFMTNRKRIHNTAATRPREISPEPEPGRAPSSPGLLDSLLVKPHGRTKLIACHIPASNASRCLDMPRRRDD